MARRTILSVLQAGQALQTSSVEWSKRLTRNSGHVAACPVHNGSWVDEVMGARCLKGKHNGCVVESRQGQVSVVSLLPDAQSNEYTAPIAIPVLFLRVIVAVAVAVVCCSRPRQGNRVVCCGKEGGKWDKVENAGRGSIKRDGTGLLVRYDLQDTKTTATVRRVRYNKAVPGAQCRSVAALGSELRSTEGPGGRRLDWIRNWAELHWILAALAQRRPEKWREIQGAADGIQVVDDEETMV